MPVDREVIALCTRVDAGKKTYSLTLYAKGQPLAPEVPFHCALEELGPPPLGQRYMVKFEVQDARR